MLFPICNGDGYGALDDLLDRAVRPLGRWEVVEPRTGNKGREGLLGAHRAEQDEGVVEERVGQERGERGGRVFCQSACSVHSAKWTCTSDL